MPISLLLGSPPPPHPPREVLVLAMTSIFNFLIINSLKESMRGCLNWHKWHVLVFIKTECWGHNNLLLLTLDCKGKLILYSNLKFTFHSQKPHYYEHWGAQRKYLYYQDGCIKWVEFRENVWGFFPQGQSKLSIVNDEAIVHINWARLSVSTGRVSVKRGLTVLQ